ncbi:MAG TPA: peptidogalycan biosysnthesis protein [Gammaproteobacteria bacterium]
MEYISNALRSGIYFFQHRYSSRIANPKFKNAIREFLDRETHGMRHYIQELQEHSPFKQSG